jgi:hypothetical protein
MDEMIDGKLYRIKKGDVIKLPSNIPHGGCLYDLPCKALHQNLNPNGVCKSFMGYWHKLWK